MPSRPAISDRVAGTLRTWRKVSRIPLRRRRSQQGPARILAAVT